MGRCDAEQNVLLLITMYFVCPFKKYTMIFFFSMDNNKLTALTLLDLSVRLIQLSLTFCLQRL